MSNLLKSKFLLGVMVVAIVLVAGAAFATPAAADCSITMTLRVGSRGVEVQCLQASLGITQDGAFGPMTKAAVQAWQTSKGLVADGVFGPISRSVWVAQGSVSGNFPAGCTSAAGYSPTTGVKCDTAPSSGLPAGCTSTSGYSSTTGKKCDGSDTPSSGGGSLSGGETDINSINIDDADDDTIDEGDSKAEVASLEFDVDDADAELVRADVVFQVDDANDEENKPWRVFDKVYLMNGSDVLASIAADDEDNWDDADDVLTGTDFDEAGADAYRLRFNNINETFNEGDNVELSIAVDVASSVDGADSGVEWGVGLEDEGLRFSDGAGLDTFASTTDVASFTIEEAGGDSELTITQDSSSPDAGNLEVDADDTTTATIAVFKVKADEDGGDVKINDFPVLVAVTNSVATVSNNDVSDVVDEVMLVIDGHTYTSEITANSTDASEEYTFEDIDDDDIIVDAGDSMLATVKIKFKSQANYDNGATIVATSQIDENDVEDADSGDDVGDVSGTPAGETQTLYSTGIVVSNFESEFDTTTDAGLVTKQTFTIDFDVTAFGDTFYIPKTVDGFDTATAMALDDTVGLGYNLESSAGVIQTAGMDNVRSTESALTSTADTVSSFFEVPEGETETFHVTIELNDLGDTAGFYHVQLTELLYDLDQVDGTLTEAKTTFAPAQDFETQDVKVD